MPHRELMFLRACSKLAVRFGRGNINWSGYVGSRKIQRTRFSLPASNSRCLERIEHSPKNKPHISLTYIRRPCNLLFDDKLPFRPLNFHLA